MTNEIRQIVFDTETTGIKFETGDRIIEVGAIELINRKRTGRMMHFYVDPEREIDEEAVAIHGWNRENLIIESGGKKFEDHADELFDFFKGAELIAHNISFDRSFIEGEFKRCGLFHRENINDLSEICTLRDTLKIARDKHPGKRNTLDALCKRYEIDNSGRELHGALLDSELLTDVYLIMTREQVTFEVNNSSKKSNISMERAKFNYKAVSIEKSNMLPTLSLLPESKNEHVNLSQRITKESGQDFNW